MMGLLLQDAAVSTSVVANNFDPQGRVIRAVEFEGLKSLDAGAMRATAGIEPGMTWERNAISAACRRLAETQKFDGVPFAEPRLDNNGDLILTFVVDERPFVATIDFVGNSQFDDGDLLNEIPIGVGSTISEFLLRQSIDTIQMKYREAGYGFVAVSVDQEALETEQRVLFRISEGPRVKVDEIVFEGNDSFEDKKLAGLIETKTAVWLLRTGAFDDETAQRDAAALKAFYVERGYLNAQVGYRADPREDDSSELIVRFQIDEGLRHAVQSISYEGNTELSNEDIQSLMNTVTGDFLDGDILRLDRERVLQEYGRRGYLYAEVTTAQVFADEPGFVHLTVKLDEGEPYDVGRVVIRGNRETKDRVIRRALQLYPEQIYNTEAAKRSEQRLVETRLFTDAKIAPQGDTPGVRDALVTVEEADTTRILFGVGVTTNSGVVGTLSIENQNFDIFDTPRTAKEFFKGRSFRGAGQTLRLRLEPGTEFTRGRIEFREPYLFDKPIGFGVALYGFERGRPEWDEQRIGFNLSFDKRLEEGPFAGWSGELAFRFENIEIGDVNVFSAPDIQDVDGNNFLTSVKATILRDRTDSRWLPSTGDRLKVSGEQAGVFGGDATFTRVIGQYDKYFTLKSDSFGRKHILQLGGTIGNIFGDSPVYERFYAGGIGSIRGFAFRGVSPRAGISNDRVGGDFMLLTNAQYSFPLVGNDVRGVAFFDMGTVEEDFGITDWRASIGLGARVYVKYFGPIPLAFDFGIPISSNDDDDEQVFSFTFGATF